MSLIHGRDDQEALPRKIGPEAPTGEINLQSLEIARRRCRARSARKRRRAISKDCRLISPVLILMASTDSSSTIERLEIRDREPGCSRTRSMYSDPFSLWYRFASALVSRK